MLWPAGAGGLPGAAKKISAREITRGFGLEGFEDLIPLPLKHTCRPTCRTICAQGDFRLYFRFELWSDIAMPNTQRKALTTYRRRLKRRGVVRLEVHVRKDDAALLRGVVIALADPEREGEARALLRERFGSGRAKGLKALLASAPLEGIDLSRDRDLGRDVKL